MGTHTSNWFTTGRNSLRRKLYRWLTWASLMLTIACTDNFLGEFVSNDTNRSKIDEIKIALNKANYERALNQLSKLNIDTNETRLLQVSALLGNAGLDLWTVAIDIANSASTTSGAVGIDVFVDNINDTIFGTDEVRETRLAALSTGVQLLESAPDREDTKLTNFACLLSAILAAPRATDGTTSMNSAITELSTISNQIASGDSCDTQGLQTQLTSLVQVAADFSQILSAFETCTIFDLSSSSLTTVEAQIRNLINNADAGCSALPDCGDSLACDALQQGCVYNVINDTTAVAGDGQIAACELLQNCLDPTTCF